MGVEITESRSRANAANSSTDSGVAGRNMVVGAQAALLRSSRRGGRKRASVLETRLVEKKRPIARDRVAKDGVVVLSLTWNWN
jgi:hypothetical protein